MANTKREIWAKRVERWQSSDLTCKEFAAEIGVNPRTLSHWKWMLSQPAAKKSSPKQGRRRAPAEPKVSFTEVLAPALVSASPPIEIVGSRGLSIRVNQAFDEETLRRVIAVVEGTA